MWGMTNDGALRPVSDMPAPAGSTAAGSTAPASDLARPDLRASDADRDRAAAVLGGAMATGRLTSAEYAERLDAVYTAKTLGDLAPLTRDLPAEDAPDDSSPATGRAHVTAQFSKVIRNGRWVAGRHTRLTSRFGALIVNFADAVVPGREITLEIDAFCGKLIIVVPEDAQVIDEGGALFSKRAVYGRGAGDADGPVIRLTGDARFSKVAVHRGRYNPYEQHVQQWVEMAEAIKASRQARGRLYDQAESPDEPRRDRIPQRVALAIAFPGSTSRGQRVTGRHSGPLGGAIAFS